jgi:hypothetical protein
MVDDSAGLDDMERRSNQVELGKLIQSVETLTGEVRELRKGQADIFEWINQAKGARRVIAWSASSIGGAIGAGATWVIQHLSRGG